MVTVKLGKLKQAGQLAKFLRVRTGISPVVKGNEIVVTGLNHRQLRLLLHKFLHERGLDGYRLVLQSGVLEILPPWKTRPRLGTGQTGGRMGLSPYSPYRMNPWTSVEFPNYPPVPPRKYKRPKRQKARA